mgnify:CR=1 FL=1
MAAPSSGYLLRGMETFQVQKYLDYVNIMSYDLHGAWDAGLTGHQGNLYDDPADLLNHLEFPGGQVEYLRLYRLNMSRRAVNRRPAVRRCRIADPVLSLGEIPDALYQHVAAGILQDQSARALSQSFGGIHMFRSRAEKQRACFVKQHPQTAELPVFRQSPQRPIQKQDVGVCLLYQFHRLCRFTGLADNSQVRLTAQQIPESGSENCVGAGQEDTNRR